MVKTVSKVRKSQKTGKHRGRNELRSDLEIKKVVYELPENERICEVCGDTLEQYAEEYICTRIFIIPEQICKVEYYRAVYKCKNCDKNAEKSNIVKAPNKTPVAVIPKGLPDASRVADIMQRKYQLGEPLYRQEQYWKLRGIYLNRTSLANWVIKGAKWFEPVIKKFWEYVWREPILNADETPLNVLKKGKTPLTKKGQMWVVCTGAAAERKIALYSYRDSRTKATAEELLKDYTGTVQTDGMASYGSGEYTHAGCWAHYPRSIVIRGNDKKAGIHATLLVSSLNNNTSFQRRNFGIFSLSDSIELLISLFKNHLSFHSLSALSAVLCDISAYICVV